MLSLIRGHHPDLRHEECNEVWSGIRLTIQFRNRFTVQSKLDEVVVYGFATSYVHAGLQGERREGFESVE